MLVLIQCKLVVIIFSACVAFGTPMYLNKFTASNLRRKTANYLQPSSHRSRQELVHRNISGAVDNPSQALTQTSHQPTAGAKRTKGVFEAYGVAMSLMIFLVTLMFYQLGPNVCFQVVLYISSLGFIKIALKMVYEHDFNYPKFITACHLLVSSSAAFVVLMHRKLWGGQPIQVPTKSEFFMGILPIASTFGFSIASENSALVFVSAAFSEVVASANPVMSAFLTWILGMDFYIKLLMPIGVVVFGCAISVTGEMHFSAAGLALLILSVFFRGLKAVMQQKLMTGETKEKFDPVTLMAWSCMCAFCVVITYSAFTEGLAPVNKMRQASDQQGLFLALLGSCVIACTLNISALFVVKHLGAVGMQMVSQMKAALVVIGGITLLSETFSAMQWGGFVTVLCGVYWYSHMQRTLNPTAKGH